MKMNPAASQNKFECLVQSEVDNTLRGSYTWKSDAQVVNVKEPLAFDIAGKTGWKGCCPGKVNALVPSTLKAKGLAASGKTSSVNSYPPKNCKGGLLLIWKSEEDTDWQYSDAQSESISRI